VKTGSLVNSIMDNSSAPVPTVGMGATILLWTDRRAATIVWVSTTGAALDVKEDTATRTDSYGMSDAQQYEYAPNPDAARVRYTRRRNGKWVREGETMRGGLGLLIGVRNQYHDYSF